MDPGVAKRCSQSRSIALGAPSVVGRAVVVKHVSSGGVIDMRKFDEL
jgi:hypothetical protein